MVLNEEPMPETRSQLDRLCKQYGIKMPMPREMPAVEEIDPDTLDGSLDMAESVMLGRVGTPLFADRPRDPSPNYSATLVRGTAGNFGLYQDYRQTETMIWDASTSVTELVASALPSIKMPSKVRRSDESAVREFVDSQNAALQRMVCLEGGWSRLVEEAMSCVWAGFSILEPVFRSRPEGGYLWAGAQPRIQSTVDRWIMRGDVLVGTEHRTIADRGPSSWTLPAIGPRVCDRHLLLFRIGGQGLDWEGDPPTRPSLHWVKMKRLLAQIIPATAEKYGVPITYIAHDPDFMRLIADTGSMRDLPDLKLAYSEFVDMQALDVPIMYLGEGVEARTVSPPGELPTIHEWVRYCDQMVAYPFSSEGNLLGMQAATGSYAQSEVHERRFLRSAPMYHRLFTSAINEQILHPLAHEQCGDLLEYPSLDLSMSRFSDNSQWIEDARNLFGPNLPVTEWPERWRKEAYERMGVAPQTEVIDSTPRLEAVND